MLENFTKKNQKIAFSVNEVADLTSLSKAFIRNEIPVDKKPTGDGRRHRLCLE